MEYWQGMIWMLVSYGIGLLSMYVYMVVKLKQFGWNWKMITGKIAEEKLLKKSLGKR